MRSGDIANKTLADPYTQLPSITFWLLGLSTVTLRDLCYAAPIILIGSLPLFFSAGA